MIVGLMVFFKVGLGFTTYYLVKASQEIEQDQLFNNK
jgi:hypothetical protein